MKSILKLLPSVFILVVILPSCSNYGDKVKKEHIEVYYKKGVTKELAQRTLDFLYTLDTTYNEQTKQKKSIQLLKKEDTIIFRMVIPMERVTSLNEDNFFALGNLLSDSVYNKTPVNIDLTDSTFNSLRILKYKKVE